MSDHDKRTLAFAVRGAPAGQGSKRHVGNGRMVEQSKRVAPWRADVKAAAEAAMADWARAHGGADWAPANGPTNLTVLLTFARPRSHYRTGRYAGLLRDDAPTWVTSAPDLDKLLRSTLDALVAAGVLADDRYVTRIWSSKTYTQPQGRPPGAWLAITAGVA